MWKAEYQPFGETYSTEATEENNRQFIGKELDDETNLSYFGARYLDSEIGRFLAPDPVRVVDQASGKVNGAILADPQRLNSYAYGLNNPYRYVDPDGESAILSEEIDGIKEEANRPAENAIRNARLIVDTAAVIASEGVLRGGIAPKGRAFWTKAEFKGQKVHQRNDLIDPKMVDARGRTNLQRMESGLAPIGPDGKSINLHHSLQTNDSSLFEMTQTFHQQNSKTVHINPSTTPSGIDRNQFNAFKKEYWINRANDF